MFAIYREADAGRYRAVYFTELGEHERETEINRAMAGDPFWDGVLRDTHKPLAKQAIEDCLRRLDAGEPVEPGDLEHALRRLGAMAE
jgi:hypothetical protein